MSVLDLSSPAFGVVALTAGFIACFFGQRLFKLVLVFGGFLVGAALANLVGGLFTDSEQVLLVASAVCGAIGAFALVSAYVAGVFLVGAAAGAVLASTLTVIIDERWLQWVLIGGLALLGGSLALKVQKVMLAISTALVGSAGIVAAGISLVLGLDHLDSLARRTFAEGDPGELGWVAIGVTGLLAVLGVATQLGLGRRKKKQKP